MFRKTRITTGSFYLAFMNIGVTLGFFYSTGTSPLFPNLLENYICNLNRHSTSSFKKSWMQANLYSLVEMSSFSSFCLVSSVKVETISSDLELIETCQEQILPNLFHSHNNWAANTVMALYVLLLMRFSIIFWGS